MIAALLVACLAAQAQERLGDNDASRRRAVRRALLALGDDAVPFLRQALRCGDPEVRRAAAVLLDALCRATARGRRSNPRYRVPGTLRRGFEPRVATELLSQPLVRVHHAPAFRGSPGDWDEPTPADWCALFRSLAGHLAAAAEGPSLVHVLAIDGLSWRIGAAGRAPHWSASWSARRFVLPAVADTLARRGAALTRVETAVYKDLLDRLARFCDAGNGCPGLKAALASAPK